MTTTATSQAVLTGQDNTIICRISQENKKASAQERTLQSLIESLIEEYNFDPEDMARDVKPDSAGGRRRIAAENLQTLPRLHLRQSGQDQNRVLGTALRDFLQNLR